MKRTRCYQRTEQKKDENETDKTKRHKTTTKKPDETHQEEKKHAGQELVAAKERFKSSRNALDSAQFWRLSLPRILRWIGAGIAVLGVLVWIASRPTE